MPSSPQTQRRTGSKIVRKPSFQQYHEMRNNIKNLMTILLKRLTHLFPYKSSYIIHILQLFFASIKALWP